MKQVINLHLSNSEFMERTELIKKYYEDIRRYKILTKEEELYYFKLYKTGTDEEKTYARNTILESNQRFVVAIAKRYGSTENMLDLINEGNIALIEAFDSFDTSKEAKFTSWAVWYIRRAINQYLIRYGQVVRRNNLPKTYHLVSQVSNKFLQKEGRSPTAEELITILRKEHNLSLKTINDVIATKYIYIDNNTKEDAETVRDVNLFNTYSANTNSWERTVEEDYSKNLVNKLLKGMNSREVDVLKYSYGIGHERCYELKEIATKMGLTSERVRQLKLTGIQKLQKKYAAMTKKERLI